MAFNKCVNVDYYGRSDREEGSWIKHERKRKFSELLEKGKLVELDREAIAKQLYIDKHVVARLKKEEDERMLKELLWKY